MKPKLSAIIPVYNEARYIKTCLESLAQQSLLPYEIIIVDDGSTDKSLDALSEFRILRQAHKGAGAARNLGAKHAAGDILVFLDADMEFDPDFLKNLVAPIITSKTKGTFSKDEYVKNWDNPWARAWSYCLGLKDSHLIPADYSNTAPVFRAILKSEFNRISGFDEHRGYDDDWSLSERLSYQATVAPGAVYYHYNPDSWGEIWRQARWRASRKYKLGIIGKIWAMLKIQSVFFDPPFSLTAQLGKLAFMSGFEAGLISPKISK